MSNRDRLVLAVGGLIVAAIGVSIGAVYLLFIWPADDCDAQARKWEDDIAKANALIAKQPQYEARLVDLAGHVFGDDEMVVSEQVRTTVTNLLTMSGLSTQNLALKPLLGTRVPNVYREIGWSVQTRGKLEQVINFMYLMTKETHLHRVDNVVLTPAPGGEVSLQVKYATLLLEMPGAKLATNTIKDQTLDPAILDSDEHHLYDIIATRDLFRPFIERPRRAVVAAGPSGGGGGGGGGSNRAPPATASSDCPPGTACRRSSSPTPPRARSPRTSKATCWPAARSSWSITGSCRRPATPRSSRAAASSSGSGRNTMPSNWARS